MQQVRKRATTQKIAPNRRQILVTGGTGAIGSAIVQALCELEAECGWQVVANYAHDDERAAQVQRATGCELMRADIAAEDQVQALFLQLPRLWAVVHAAAVVDDGLVVRHSTARWHKTMRVNANGAFLVVRESMEKLAEGGRLVLLGSRVGEHGGEGQCAYAAGKGALLGLMRCAAGEGANRGITVNVLCPPLVVSALTVAIGEVKLNAARAQSVFRELGRGSDVASAVVWLLGENADRISGQVIHCDSRI